MGFPHGMWKSWRRSAVAGEGILDFCTSPAVAFLRAQEPPIYPGGVDAPLNPSFIPAEAQARQARLAHALAAMEAAAPSREPAPLQALRRAIGETSTDAAALVAALVSADLAEEGRDLLRGARRRAADPGRATALAGLLEPHAARAQARREAGWQLDTRRACLRVAYAKEGEALDLDDGDLHALFLQAFRLEGLPLALDLGKRPRPLLRLDLPLPAGAGGEEEWVELVLRSEPREDGAALLARLDARLPAGLRLLRWEAHPAYASPLAELAEAFHWRWACPPEQVEAARARTGAFLAAATWVWEKGGRVEGRKQVKALDLRPLVTELSWEGATLRSLTRAEGTANPLRLHAAILGLEPGDLAGLVREAIAFRPDPRLGQAERFEPKLKNLYEDAVLLSGGSNITLVDEDDDEPLRLG